MQKKSKKKQKCKKKAENARSISKFMQKRAEMQKKAENAFQFENSCKKRAKMEKKESTFIWICFAFISLVHFFLHFKPKNSYKKRQK